MMGIGQYHLDVKGHNVKVVRKQNKKPALFETVKIGQSFCVSPNGDPLLKIEIQGSGNNCVNLRTGTLYTFMENSEIYDAGKFVVVEYDEDQI
jgi:hypothetical protein